MKVLKTKNKRNDIYIQKCCNCKSKLEFNAADVEHNFLNDVFFTCPLCDTQQYLNSKNRIKYKIFTRYNKKSKEQE